MYNDRGMQMLLTTIALEINVARDNVISKRLCSNETILISQVTSFHIM